MKQSGGEVYEVRGRAEVAGTSIAVAFMRLAFRMVMRLLFRLRMVIRLVLRVGVFGFRVGTAVSKVLCTTVQYKDLQLVRKITCYGQVINAWSSPRITGLDVFSAWNLRERHIF